jgi:hypothetical protein
MMDLGRSLFSVLNTTSAVSVEGLGVFVRQRTPAQRDATGTRLLPPSVDFHLKADGDSSAVSLQAYLEATDPLASVDWKAEIAVKVEEIVDGLLAEQKVALLPLGYLVQEGTEVRLVAPEENYVWPTFEIPTVLPAMPTEVTTVQEEEAIASPSLAPVASEKPLTAFEQKGESQEIPLDEVESTTSKNSGWLIALLLIILAGVGVFFVQPQWLINLLPQTETAKTVLPVSEPTGDPLPPRVSHFDSIQQVQLRIDSLKKDSIAHMNALADSLAKVSPAKPKVTYEIIVGSFVSMAQAEKYVNEMKAKGITLHALDSRMPGNRKKVSWGSYPTEEAAYNELVKVQREFEKGAWVARVVHD